MNKSEIYMLIRSGLSGFGGPFGAIATIWSELEQEENIKRIEQLFQNLKAITDCHSREIDELKQDKNKAKDAFDCLSSTVKILVEDINSLKVDYYAKIAYNTMVSSDPIEDKIQIIEQFGKLSMKDIKILELLDSKGNEVRRWTHGHGELSFENLIPSIVKLESAWLIERDFSTNHLGITLSSDSSINNEWKNRRYKLTQYGQKLWNLLQSPV